MGRMLVTFDLNSMKRGNQYQTQRQRIHSEIRFLDPNAFQYCKQTWIMNSGSDIEEIRDRISRWINPNYNERLLVIEFDLAAWYGGDPTNVKRLLAPLAA
jgi:hypothetical protein